MEIYEGNQSDFDMKPMWFDLIILWANLHTQMLENVLNLIRLVKSSVFQLSQVSISKDQEAASFMDHATLTCWNATSMLFAAALGRR